MNNYINFNFLEKHGNIDFGHSDNDYCNSSHLIGNFYFIAAKDIKMGSWTIFYSLRASCINWIVDEIGRKRTSKFRGKLCFISLSHYGEENL